MIILSISLTLIYYVLQGESSRCLIIQEHWGILEADSYYWTHLVPRSAKSNFENGVWYRFLRHLFILQAVIQLSH